MTQRSTDAPFFPHVLGPPLALALALAGAVAAHAHGAPDPTAGLDLATVNARSIALVQERRFVASLPYFRRELELVRPDVWALHLDYAAALEGASLEGASRRGNAVPATRSTSERVALMRESLAQLDLASRLAPGARERARVAEARAHHLRVWGLVWDAAADYRQAVALDPKWGVVAERARAHLAELRDPARPGAGSEAW